MKWELGGEALEEKDWKNRLRKHAKWEKKTKGVYISFLGLLEQCASKQNDLKQIYSLSVKEAKSLNLRCCQGSALSEDSKEEAVACSSLSF